MTMMFGGNGRGLWLHAVRHKFGSTHAHQGSNNGATDGGGGDASTRVMESKNAVVVRRCGPVIWWRRLQFDNLTLERRMMIPGASPSESPAPPPRGS